MRPSPVQRQSILTISLIVSSLCIYAQDSLRQTRQDSVVCFTPYYSEEFSSSGNFMVKIDDPKVLRLSSGISIFNVLRGRVPSLSIEAFAPYARPGLRNPYSMRIIDGVQFNESISNYYNLNAFEYSDISAVPSNNALTFLNQQGSGAFILTSKTGEGFEKPTFEFNSYATLGWRETKDFFWQELPEKQWFLSNTFSYQQDFGKIDTRASYNFLSQPKNIAYSPSYHTLKINTGFELTPRLKIRLILDDFYHQYDFDMNTNSDPGQSNYVDGSYNFLQGNMTISYQWKPWIKLTSQVVFSALDSLFSDDRNTQGIDLKLKGNLDRLSANLFASMEKQLDYRYTFKAFAGVQFSNHNRKSTLDYTLLNNSATYKADLTESDVVGGVGIDYKKIIHTTGMYRLSRYQADMKSYDGESESSFNSLSSYSFSAAFVFSRLINSGSSWGKLRASIGRNKELPYSGSPIGSTFMQSSPIYPSSDSAWVTPELNQSMEAGTDLHFLGSKVTLGTSFYKRKVRHDNQDNSYDYRKSYVVGWEADLRFVPVHTSKFTYQIGLVTNSFQSKREYQGVNDPMGGWYPSDDSYRKADWITNLLSQASWENCIFSFNFERISLRNETKFVKLRDISLGCTFKKGLIAKMNLESLHLSLSGRNLIIIKSGDDFEENYFSLYIQKSVSVNLNIAF